MVPAGQGDDNRLGACIDEGMNLGVESSLGPSHGLCSLSTGRIGPVSMNLDVSTVDKMPSRSELRPELSQHLFERTALTPATKILVDRVPAGLGSIDRSPAATLC